MTGNSIDFTPDPEPKNPSLRTKPSKKTVKPILNPQKGSIKKDKEPVKRVSFEDLTQEPTSPEQHKAPGKVTEVTTLSLSNASDASSGLARQPKEAITELPIQRPVASKVVEKPGSVPFDEDEEPARKPRVSKFKASRMQQQQQPQDTSSILTAPAMEAAVAEVATSIQPSASVPVGDQLVPEIVPKKKSLFRASREKML
jgi:hypothetical protein